MSRSSVVPERGEPMTKMGAVGGWRSSTVVLGHPTHAPPR